ncbi:right-handed parallel beta-helix repeat-containing protein [Hymenobacter sp. ASUV-10]|uniref:Right-handed parallel beta-helix repeat-containing protein n=1 Tax=Hymenobacter aranciens TaxID=3063996 RepID=A0ABT9BGQ6_9BACT|nr:right-handed parallel beta-helix repeat-containing protein [Hymenobacter sp. ASUV-10]MDO7876848.1 right-handed parallel beta-helix repeat-containing protein [Hymenobacter sp. ASUV-10]
MRERTLLIYPSGNENHQSGRLRRLGRWLSLALLALSGPAAFAQLSGTYTINSALPTGGTNYASFGAAATALATGVSGPVTFNVSGGPYTEQLALSAISGASATNRITFNGNGRTIRFGSSTTGSRAVVALNGADYVTIDSLNIDATNGGTPGTYGWGVHLTGQADNNIVRRSTITTSTSATTTNYAGIVVSGSASTATTTGNNANNLLLERNTIIGGYYGVTLIGSSASRGAGNVLRNNIIRNFYYYGVYDSYQNGVLLSGNDLSRPNRGDAGTGYGLYVYYNTGGRVENNRLHDFYTASPTSTLAFYGVYLYYSDGTSGAPIEVVNNQIHHDKGAGVAYGLYNYYSDFVNHYHNTVVFDNPAQATGNVRAAYIYNSNSVALRNNILYNTQPSSSGSFAYYNYATATYTGQSSNYNDLYVAPGGYIGYSGTSTAATTGATTLAAWQNQGFDQNSVSANPIFVNAAANNLTPTAAAVNAAGTTTTLATVPRDANGTTRTSPPDLGALEFTPATNDVGLVRIDSPTAPVGVGSAPVSITLLNNGISPLTTVQVQYVLNNGTPVTQVLTLSPALASGASRTVSFTTPATLVSGINTLSISVSAPNGAADPTPSNNTLSATFYTALAGVYTIDKTLPTSGRNFASFTDAAAALNSSGIAASVRFNVLNGPYNEQFSLGVVAGVSATDTIGVDGGASKQTLRYSGTVSQPAAVLLNGTDYVTLNNLTIDVSAGATYGVGVHLVGQANNNRISNSVIVGTTTATSATANSAIATSGSVTSGTSAGDANNLRIENNVLSGGYYCLRVNGLSTASPGTGLRIIGNEVRDFYFYGVYLSNSSGPRILANNVHRPVRSTTTFYGIYLTGVVGANVERNRIHDPFGTNTASTSASYAFYLTASDATAAAPNDFVNNAVYSFNSNGTEYGVYNTSSDYMRLFHNTIVLDNANAGGTGISYGFYQTTAATGIDIRNNLFSITRGGTAARYALYFVTTTSGITSNYNDLHIGAGTNYYTGRFGTVNYATLANWRTANSGAYDANSLQENPLFVAAATGNLEPTAVILNGAGTPALLTRVPTDLVGTARTGAPDPGAVEFTPVSNDVAVVSIDAPTATATPGINPVTVTIRNGGTAVLTAVTLSYVVDSGTPVSQNFTGLTLAAGATQQLTFTNGFTVASGPHTLTVTGSLPNGAADGNATNNSQTISFNQPTPDNDEPCTAIGISSTPVAGSNSGASASQQTGIVLPSCSPAAAPKDVWFSFTPTTPDLGLNIAGSAAGMVRVFTSPDCAAGPFTQVFCQSSGANNAGVGNVTLTGLAVGQRYYVAISGFGSSDTEGAFTISTTVVTGTRHAANYLLTVFPNPSNTGQLTLRLAGSAAGTGTAELLNALGQSVLRQPLSGAEAELSTRGLAAGLYTLQVRAGGQVMTRKVVLQ